MMMMMMMANINKEEAAAEAASMSTRTPPRRRRRTTTTSETLKIKEDSQMDMARKLADYLGEVTGYSTFDTEHLPNFFREFLIGPTEVPLVAAEDVRSSDVDQFIKEVFEGGDVLNWWTPEVQLLLPICDEGAIDVDCSKPGLNKSRLNASLQYLRTHINIIFEGKYFMKVHHKVQEQVCHQDDNEDKASQAYYQERLTSQEVSIFTLSNILRQPIVVLSKGRTRDSVGGIYLPFRVAPSDCKKWPLVIGYHLGTYYPLIAVKEEHQFDDQFLLPLVYSDLKPFVVKCRSFVNSDNCKDVRNSYLNTVIYQNDHFIQICAAQLRCPVVKRLDKSKASAYERREREQSAVISGESRTLVAKHIESQLWTPFWNNNNNNNINKTIDSKKDTRDFLVTRCLAEGCEHAASLVSKHPLCSTCEASMKRQGVIRIGLMSASVQPLSRMRSTGQQQQQQQHSRCRCPCGKNGGSVSSSDEEYSESDENPNDESLNDLNVLNEEFRNVDTCYMNLPIDYGLRI